MTHDSKPAQPQPNAGANAFTPPANLYDGITGTDPEHVAQARADRENGLLSQLTLNVYAAKKKGDSAEEAKTTHELLQAQAYFDNKRTKEHEQPQRKGVAAAQPPQGFFDEVISGKR